MIRRLSPWHIVTVMLPFRKYGRNQRIWVMKVALTIDFKKTVKDRVERDPAFREGITQRKGLNAF